MNTFPKCQTLQGCACEVLLKLARCSIGKTKAIEAGGVEVFLAAVNSHLDSADVRESACRALVAIADGNRKHTERLISLGGGAVVAKVRNKWPDNDQVKLYMRSLTRLFLKEMKSWVLD
jgi:hypothetical protein